MNLDLFTARLRFINRRAVDFPAFGAANLIRGQFGRELFQNRHELYERLFAPPRRIEGPSGFKDPPRPYVLRTRHLDGRRFAAGETLEFFVNVFDLKLLAEFGSDVQEQLSLNLAPSRPASRTRIGFISPTELKGAEQPEFGVLLARLRDRVSSLRALYGAGELEIDFRAFGERARQVAMSRCAIQDVDRMRISRRSGQRHSIGGFIGEAVYEGDLGEFLPFLEAGAFTGVGRQTVWGKGEIALLAID
jgi:hypothetical protein